MPTASRQEKLPHWDTWVLASISLVWGSLLIVPGDLFATIPRYQYVDAYAPDWVWGCFFLAFGLVQLADIWLKVPHWLCRHVHVWTAILWLGIGCLSLLSGISIPNILIISLVIAASLIHVGIFLKRSEQTP